MEGETRLQLKFEPAKKDVFGISNLYVTRCASCEGIALWKGWNLVYPKASAAPLPNEDLPSDCLDDYKEAATILHDSPRGAAALLRLAIQKLCKHLGEEGRDINADIAALVKKGLSEQIRKALDAIRVIGNESVHPGTMDMRDDVETATKLFHAINVVANVMITQPKEIDALYDQVPPGKQVAADRRDGREPGEVG
jgi:hypothetical protein